MYYPVVKTKVGKAGFAFGKQGSLLNSTLTYISPYDKVDKGTKKSQERHKLKSRRQKKNKGGSLGKD